VLGCELESTGGYRVRLAAGDLRARHVLLAVGRRGSPRKLGVPGEDLPKVAYGLLDAHSYQGRRVLVVGGGDSAAETALALAEQPGNQVLLSYRRDSFFRVRERNLGRLEQASAEGRLQVLLQSEVLAVHPDAVDVELASGGARRAVRVANDDVFVMAGGTAPVELFSSCGVSCDPDAARRAGADRRAGHRRAARARRGVRARPRDAALGALARGLLPLAARGAARGGEARRPAAGVGLGLAFGVVATALVAVNFLYLARRAAGAGCADRCAAG
jgi:hypothetical protein